MKHMWLAALALSCTGAAFAAEQSYRAQGVLVPFGNPLDYQTYGYMEVWGVGDTSRYAQPATDTGDVYHNLIAGSDAASAVALSGYVGASVNFSYDPTASPSFVSASGNSARYAIGPMQVRQAGSGLTPVDLAASDTRLSVSRSSNGHLQLLTFTRTAGTIDGPIPGSTFSYGAAAPGSFQVDLVSLLGPSAYYVSGFDLSAFASLPVRLTAPSVFRPVGFTVVLSRVDATANYGIAPPAALNLSDWNDSATIGVYYDGIYGVAVNPADYASNSAYLAASAWVDANIRQINFEQSLTYTIALLNPVPEPAAAWLLLAGLAPLLLHVRRRRAA